MVQFASLNRTFHLSPHENICTIALITIHYLYNISDLYHALMSITRDRDWGTALYLQIDHWLNAAVAFVIINLD